MGGRDYDTGTVPSGYDAFGIWLAWALVNAVPAFLGVLFGALMLGGTDTSLCGGGSIFLAGFTAPVLGTVGGLGQWLVLRRRLSKAGLWIVRTFVGGFLTTLLLLLIGDLTRLVVTGAGGCSKPEAPWLHVFLSIIIAGSVFGAVFGRAQQGLLQRHYMRAGWWVVANIVGWTASFAGFELSYWVDKWFVNITRSVPGIAELVEPVVVFAPAAIMPGALTGVALVYILRAPSPRGLPVPRADAR